jgi:hypothetical protein
MATGHLCVNWVTFTRDRAIMVNGAKGMKDKNTANDNTVTRARAVVQGLLFEVSPMAQKAGIPYPVFITKRVHESCIVTPNTSEGEPEQRIKDLTLALRMALARIEPGQTRIKLSFVPQVSKSPSSLYQLEVVCAPLEKNLPIPALTIIWPGEA